MGLWRWGTALALGEAKVRGLVLLYLTVCSLTSSDKGDGEQVCLETVVVVSMGSAGWTVAAAGRSQLSLLGISPSAFCWLLMQQDSLPSNRRQGWGRRVRLLKLGGLEKYVLTPQWFLCKLHNFFGIMQCDPNQNKLFLFIIIVQHVLLGAVPYLICTEGQCYHHCTVGKYCLSLLIYSLCCHHDTT